MKVTILLGAIVSGVVVAFLAVLMGGAGHGWTAAIVSMTAVLTAPLGAAAWLLRSRGTAFVAVATNLVLDTTFVVRTFTEGLEYAAKAVEHMPHVVVAWAALWIGWQVPPVLAAFTPGSTGRSPRDP